MTALRLQNDPSFEDDEVNSSDSEVESNPAKKTIKTTGRVGRPRGKGRPKRSTKLVSKKQSEEEEEWQQKNHGRERATPGKQQSSIEGYIKIIDYLKKIDYDEHNLQNKMSPYNALTATCFWYAVSSEFFSYDFSAKRHANDTANELFEKIQKLPLPIPNRVIKTVNANPSLLESETEELNRLGREMSERMANMIPAQLLTYRAESIERKLTPSTVSQDDEFLSSTRSMLYNYIDKKVKTSQKWAALVNSYGPKIEELPSKQFRREPTLEFPKEEEPTEEVNLFELLRQQAKKKVQKREFNRINRLSKDNDIFQEDSHREGDENVIRDPNEIKEEDQHEEQLGKQNKVDQEQEPIEEMDVEKHEIKEEEPEKGENREEARSGDKNEDKIDDVKQEIENCEVLQQGLEEHIKESNEQKMKSHAEEGNENNEDEDESQSEDKVKQQIVEYMTKDYGKQDVILNSILHMPIDKIISILQSSLPTIRLPEIKESMMPIPTKDPLEFVFQLHPEEERYLEYMKEQRRKKYREKTIRSENCLDDEEKDGQYEDAKCQICTDGDYTDDNLIVFCSMCNISLHQRCVGLSKVPAESWVCDLCTAFGPAGINLPCPLCNVKGGAMKRTSIHIDSNVFKETNPGYYEYAKKCPYLKQKEEYIPKQKPEDGAEKEEDNADNLIKVVREKGDGQEECHYDYFVKSTYPSDVPTCHYVWVHYVCAIWVPECYFEQKNGAISVKGIETIDHKRFKTECFVCRKNKCGAAVKCEDSECHKFYHPECARKKKVYMEQLNLEKLKYLIFCEEHEPLKLTRQIEYKKKKSRQEIIKFARMIEKYIETYRIAQFPFKLMKSAIPSTFIDSSHKQQREHKDRRALAAHSDEEFLKEVIANLGKAKMMTIHLEKVETGYKITTVDTPSKREIRKCLNRYDQFWNSIKNRDSNEDNFRRYERLMENPKMKEKLELFLNGSLAVRPKTDDKREKKVGRKRGKNAPAQVETLIEEEGGIFCICKKPYEGQTDMFECEICGQWYHFKCLGFIGSEEDAQSMEFSCMKCMKFENAEQKDERMRKYAGMFSSESILYLYRPPTPDLLSEEELEQKNYTEILDEIKKKTEQSSIVKKDNTRKAEESSKKAGLNQHSGSGKGGLEKQASQVKQCGKMEVEVQVEKKLPSRIIEAYIESSENQLIVAKNEPENMEELIKESRVDEQPPKVEQVVENVPKMEQNNLMAPEDELKVKEQSHVEQQMEVEQNQIKHEEDKGNDRVNP